MSEKILLNNKEVTQEEFDQQKRKLEEDNSGQIVKLEEGKYITRLYS